ncbi:MAG: aldehyde dehydrogenase family protein [Actinobacteria bacterium]|nr:aldehyde dehydrogenase family protein [Actinomycetota bacterium]
MPDIANLVAGRWVPPSGGGRLVTVDPADDTPLLDTATSDAAEVDRAIAAAAAAAAPWAATPAAARAAVLRRWAAAVDADRDRLAELQRAETGRPTASGLGAVDAAVSTIEELARLAVVHRGRSLNGDASTIDEIRHVPRGVAAVILPWNDPVPILAQGVAANLGVGNAVVAKPSERATACGVAMVQLLVGCGLPVGAVNLVVGGSATGAAVAGHGGVDVVLATGSVRMGRAVAAACAARGAKAVLELGGKDALVVGGDVDVAWAAGQAALGSFANMGQICTSVERIYVAESLHDDFVAALAKEADAWERAPLVDRAHRAAVHAHVVDAVERGATVVTGGAVPDGPGAWYPPTVLTEVAEDALVLGDETFGPVAPVGRVADAGEGLRRAAASPFGLAATVLTADMAVALAAAQLPVGTVKVNAVFGGAPGGSADPHGISGQGVGYGPELLDELTRRRVLHWQPPG